IPEARLALVGEDLVDRFAGVRGHGVVGIHKGHAQRRGHEPSHGAFTRAAKAHEYDCAGHASVKGSRGEGKEARAARAAAIITSHGAGRSVQRVKDSAPW